MAVLASPTSTSVLVSAGQDRRNYDGQDENRIREMVKELLVEQPKFLHENILRRVTAERQRSREAASE